ncbi:MAG: hypothetical protein R3D55_14390 [Chloroflexota bacterium]
MSAETALAAELVDDVAYRDELETLLAVQPEEDADFPDENDQGIRKISVLLTRKKRPNPPTTPSQPKTRKSPKQNSSTGKKPTACSPKKHAAAVANLSA